MSRDSVRSPLGSLLDELRQSTVRPSRPSDAAPATRPAHGPEPDLHIEAGIVSGASGPGRPRSWRWAVAIAVHAAFIAAILIVPLVMPQDLPAPAGGVRAFLVQTIVAPPPPPPPPPAAGPRAVVRREPSARTPARAVPAVVPAPELRPDDVVPAAPPSLTPPATAALDEDEGVPGGVEGGVPGGVVGGILQADARGEAATTHVRVGGAIREPRKLRSVAPVYPDVAARGKIEGVVLLELGIRPDGRVEDVRVLRSIPLLDEAAIAAARQWLFSPTLVGGVPVSVTMTVSVRFSLTQQTASY
jgi:protein TonB